jgi:hypothetical protein
MKQALKGSVSDSVVKHARSLPSVRDAQQEVLRTSLGLVGVGSINTPYWGHQKEDS